MKKFSCLFLLCIFHFSCFSTTIFGGDVSNNCISGLTQQLTVTLWGNHFSPDDSLHVYFGDGTYTVYSNQSAFSLTSLAPNFPNDSVIKWVFTHTYSGAATYPINVSYANRDTGIANIPNSGSTILVLNAILTIDPFIGCNSSPYFANSQLIELVTVSATNNFNLGAFDPDGDSLSYSFLPCSDTSGTISGYTTPDVIGGGTFGVDAVTGNYYWNTPQVLGEYNFVLQIKEWKLFSNGQRYLIGTVMREIQLDVVTAGTGTEETNSISFSCFPNPLSTNKALHFQFKKSGNYFLQLLDVNGNLVFENSGFSENEKVVYLPFLPPGTYFVNVYDEAHLLSTRKILIQNP